MDAAGKDGTIKHVMSGVNPKAVGRGIQAAYGRGARPRFLVAMLEGAAELGAISIFNRFLLQDCW